MTSVWPWIISFSASQGVQIDTHLASIEGLFEATEDPSFGVHALTHAGLAQQLYHAFFKGPGADSAKHIVRALTFENEGIDAGVVQPLTEQQTGKTGANDGNLGFRASLFIWLPSSTRPGSLSEFYGSSACIFHLRVCQLRVKTEPISVHSANRCDYRPSSISRPGLK